MSEAIPNLIAASKEFDQELVAITATIAKAKQGVAELIVEKTVLSDKLYAALKYIEDTKPAPPTLPPQENVIKTKIKDGVMQSSIIKEKQNLHYQTKLLFAVEDLVSLTIKELLLQLTGKI